MMWTVFYKGSVDLHASVMPRMGPVNFYDNVNRDELTRSLFDLTDRQFKKWQETQEEQK